MPTPSPKRIADLIDRFEFKIDSGLITPEYLNGVQQQIDSLPEPEKGDVNKYYQYGAELQALVYKERGNTADMRACIATAITQAGSPKGLRSRILKGYLRSQPVEASANPTVQSADLSMLSSREQRFMWSHGLQGAPDVKFLVRSPAKLFLLMLLSGGIYYLYWSYKNWCAICDATGRKISPFWRTAFTIFYMWPLFTTIVLLAKQRGFDKNYSGNWLAAGYLFSKLPLMPLYLSSDSQLVVIAVQLLGMCASAAFLIPVQQAAIFAATGQASEKAAVYPKLKPVEVVFVVLGAVGVLSAGGNQISHVGPGAGHGSVWHQMRVNMAKQRVTALTQEYKLCSAYIKDNQARVDASNKQEVASYNTYVAQCEAIHERQGQAVNAYNKLAGGR